MTTPTLPDGYSASQVSPGLWIGPAPPVDYGFHGFHALVLAAAEVQPMAMAYQGRIWRVRLFDVMSQSLTHTNSAIRAGRAVASALQRHEHVLVTCYAGQNRSALIAGLALLQTYSELDGYGAIELIRGNHSPQALSNPAFCQTLIEYGKRLGRHRGQRRSLGSVGG